MHPRHNLYSPCKPNFGIYSTCDKTLEYQAHAKGIMQTSSHQGSIALALEFFQIPSQFVFFQTLLIQRSAPLFQSFQMVKLSTFNQYPHGPCTDDYKDETSLNLLNPAGHITLVALVSYLQR